jgi:hypothetical protein
MTKRCEPPIVIDYTEHTWKEVDDIKKELIQKNATIRQLEKIIYKLYTSREELSTGDLHNIIRIVEGYNGK